MNPRQISVTFAAFAAMLVLAALDQTILATALPAIIEEFHGASEVSWVFSAYLIASTVAVPLYGKLADVYGSKPVLLWAIGLFLLGSLLCGFSSSMTELVIARAVQGAGGGGLLTLTMLGVVDLFPLEQRGKYQGLLGAAYGISTMFGPLVGGYVVEHLSWHWAFFINVPVAVVALVILTASFRPPASRHPHPVDWLGAALLSATLVCLLLATRREGGEGALGGGGIPLGDMLSLLAAASVLALSFIIVERRAAHPLLPLTLFTQRDFMAATLVSAASGVVLFAAVVFLPMYLQNGLGHSPTGSSWRLMPVSVGITVAAILSGRMLRSQGRVRAMAVGACLLSASSFAALALVFNLAPEQVGWMSLVLFPLGLGIGALFPLVTVVSQFSVPPRMIGVGTSTPIMVRTLGGALGIAVMGSLLAHGIVEFASHGSPRSAISPFAAAFAAGIQPVYLCAALVCLLGAAAALLLPRRLAKPGSGTAGPNLGARGAGTS